MKSLSAFALAGLAALSLAAPGASAHHSFSAYNRSESAKRTLRGTVTEFALINPHGRLKVSVQEAGGKRGIWSFELSSATQLAGLGWRTDSVRAGTPLEVTFFPLRLGSYGGLLLSIRLPGGRVLQGTSEPDRGYPKPKH